MASALGFGGINVTSSLGQPLSAEIELVAVDKADQSSLNAHLASLDAFKAAGMDYPSSLPKIKFQVETRPNGESYIKATTDQPVNEPFVSLLLEVTWSSGRLLREYTFLLDPPGFEPEKPAETPVQPIAPVIASAPAAVPAAAPAPESAPAPTVIAPQASAPAAAPEPAMKAETAPEAQATASAPQAAEPEVKQNTAAEVAASTVTAPEEKTPPPQKRQARSAVTASETQAAGPALIPVKNGDSLSNIALKIKSPEVSLERMLVALYRTNTEQFDGHNMNRIRSGKILRAPEASVVDGIPQVEAEKEVQAQVEDWNAYRQKMATANTAVGEQGDKQEVSGKLSTSVAEKTPEVKENAKEVLKLSKGEAVGDKTVAGGKEQANAREEEEIAKAKALQDAQQRAAMLEKNIQEMQHLVQLKKQAVSAPAPASAVAAVKPVAAAPKKGVPEPSLVDELLANPVALGGGAAAILGLALLGMVQARKRKNTGKKISPPPVVGNIAEPLQEVLADETSAENDEVDPIKEADLFLNFGRDVQAEEVLKEALLKDPDNNKIKLKLLSIYETRFDTESFYNYAAEIKASGDKPAWEQAAAMGLRIDPHNEFYGGIPAVQEVGIPDEVIAAEPEASNPEREALDFDSELPPALDFELDDADLAEVPQAVSSADLPVQEISMDFDIGDEKLAETSEAKPEIPALDVDFNLDEEKLAAPVESAPTLNLDDLVFDAPGAEPEPAAKPEKAEDISMDFSLDDALADTGAGLPDPAKALGLDDISLDLDVLGATEEPAAAKDGKKDERWQEVATKLDLARAYQEMGDQAGAREILEEVVRDGDEGQRETAQNLLSQLS